MDEARRPSTQPTLHFAAAIVRALAKSRTRSSSTMVVRALPKLAPASGDRCNQNPHAGRAGTLGPSTTAGPATRPPVRRRPSIGSTPTSSRAPPSRSSGGVGLQRRLERDVGERVRHLREPGVRGLERPHRAHGRSFILLRRDLAVVLSVQNHNDPSAIRRRALLPPRRFRLDSPDVQAPRAVWHLTCLRQRCCIECRCGRRARGIECCRHARRSDTV